jgi:phospholipid transport system transporter-binding protein
MKLPEHATLEQAAELALALPAALAEGGGALRIDASQLKAFDSSTIALLMQAHRLAQAAGRGFEVTGVPAQLTQLAQLYGVDGLLSPSNESSAPRPTPA